MREIVISMKLNRHLYRLALHLRTRYKNMEVVAGVMGTSSRTVRNWKTSKKITITPQIIEGLNSCGYDIAVVPIDEKDS